jgi:hypothetical protein
MPGKNGGEGEKLGTVAVASLPGKKPPWMFRVGWCDVEEENA